MGITGPFRLEECSGPPRNYAARSSAWGGGGLCAYLAESFHKNKSLLWFCQELRLELSGGALGMKHNKLCSYLS